ncbi:MAG TPA: Gfo/Idh/MocA family oxidoreductase [Fimbriimonas sp.]
MAKELTRRDVLMGSAATVVAIAASKVAAESTQPTPRGRLRVGVIGSGGKGWSGMQDAAQFGDIVAICDVDAKARSTAMLEHPSASTFEDYREMYEAMRGKMDAVVISTPDHHHYLAAMLAMRAGLHTYCEKPLTRSIWEARQMARTARERRVATQMGNHSTANTPMRKMAALIQAGTFGPVKEAHLWTDRAAAYWKQGLPRPERAIPPKHVDFDLWLGPSPERPYGEGYHPFAWRGWWDFGTGALGDMGCHIFNMPYMALDLRDPVAVRAETSGHNHDSFPEWAIVHYEFPERRGRGPVALHWYDGGKRPDPALAKGVSFGGNGSLVVCEKATIYCPDEGNWRYEIVGGGSIPDIAVEESPGHMAEFFRAASGGKPARSNFPDYAGPLTETVLLGNLAIWANGPRLEWDAKRMQVKGHPEYEALIKPKYRRGWDV